MNTTLDNAVKLACCSMLIAASGCAKYKVNIKETDTGFRAIPETSKYKSRSLRIDERLIGTKLEDKISYEDKCDVAMQLFYRSQGTEYDTLRSNRVCIKTRDQTTFKTIRAADFQLFNVQRDGTTFAFKRAHYCEETSKKAARCTWNGRIRHKWPLSVRLIAGPQGAPDLPNFDLSWVKRARSEYNRLTGEVRELEQRLALLGDSDWVTRRRSELTSQIGNATDAPARESLQKELEGIETDNDVRAQIKSLEKKKAIKIAEQKQAKRSWEQISMEQSDQSRITRARAAQYDNLEGKITAFVGGVHVYLNGELYHVEVAQEGRSTLEIDGRDLIADRLPFDAPISLHLLPASGVVATSELKGDKDAFEYKRMSALQTLTNTLALYGQRSGLTAGLDTEVKCMALHARFVYGLAEQISTGNAQDMTALSAEWNASCKNTNYATALEEQKACWDVDGGLDSLASQPSKEEQLSSALAAIDTPLSLTMKSRWDYRATLSAPGLLSAQTIPTDALGSDALEQDAVMIEGIGKELHCAKNTALASVSKDLKALREEVSKSATALLDFTELEAATRQKLIELHTSTASKFLDTDLSQKARDKALQVFATELAALEQAAIAKVAEGARRDELVSLFEAYSDTLSSNKLEEVARVRQALDDIHKLSAELDAGLYAIRTNYRTVRGKVVTLLEDEEQALVLYTSLAEQLPTQNDLFVKRKKNPQPGNEVYWGMELKHLDRWQRFHFATWNAVPLPVKGTAYVQPIDVSTAIPVVDAIGLRVNLSPRFDLRGALGAVVFKEQLLVELEESEDFAADYVNGGPVGSIGLNSLRFGIAYVVRTPYSRGVLRENELDMFAQNEKNLFGARGYTGSSRFRIFVGVDLFKLIFNDSTGYSESTSTSQEESSN